MKQFLRIFFISAISVIASQPLQAVTDKEMEEARTITAITYLRYANDLSGYLDEHHPKTMGELNKILKEKEKENLKAFNAIQTPKDYASWDKEKLIAYWSGTFFSSPGLSDKGKIGKSRVKSRLSNMTVSAPTASTQPETTKTEEPKKDTVASEIPPTEPVAAAEGAGDQTKEEVDSLLALSEADAGLDEASREKRGSSTVWYIVILCVLVAAVICLVFYASKALKENMAKQTGDDRKGEGPSIAERAGNADMREKFAATLAQKNEEIRRMARELEILKEENASLRRERQSAPVSSAPVAPTRTEPQNRTIYLGRVNNRGLFVRADRRVNPETSVYRLDTEDGVSGSFRVLTDPEVDDRLLSDPIHWLGGGCLSNSLEDTDGYAEIRTLSAGTAIFQDGAWKVIRKADISYE